MRGSRSLLLAVLALGNAAVAQDSTRTVVVGKEEIDSSGLPSLGDLLQRLPEMGSAANTNVNAGGSGETQLNLRSLGAPRTLVLVDGRRWVPASLDAKGAIDLNSIPGAAIDRIEVREVGDVAAFGSGGIGGVVNLVTRSRFQGFEAHAYGGVSPHGDARQIDLALSAGAASEAGSVFGSVGWFDQSALLAGSRDWAAQSPIYDFSSGSAVPNLSNRIPNGRAQVYLSKWNSPGGQSLAAARSACFAGDQSACAALDDPNNYGPACASKLCGDLRNAYQPQGTAACTWNSSAPGARAPTGCALIVDNNPARQAGARVTLAPLVLVHDTANPASIDGWHTFTNADLYDFTPSSDLITPSRRISLFLKGDGRLGQGARVYLQGSLMNRRSNDLGSAEPFDSGAFGVSVSADNEYNPFGQPLTDVRRRLLDAGGRGQAADLSTLRVVAGVEGKLANEFGPLQGLDWDLSLDYGRTFGTVTSSGSLDTRVTIAAAALGPSFQDSSMAWHCGSPGAPIAGCVPADLFADPGSMSAGQLAALGVHRGVDHTWTQLASAQLNLARDLFQIASRPARVMGGYEFRAESGAYTPNDVALAQADSDFNPASTHGAIHSNEVWARLGVPLADALDVRAAARLAGYSSFGWVASWQIGAHWQPFPDLTLRGSLGTGFRAPSIVELYGGSRSAAGAAVDPCSIIPIANPALAAECKLPPCNANCGLSAFTVRTGGNVLLQPETSRTASIGFELVPRPIPRLVVTLDYWNISVSDQIIQVDPQTILNGCYPAAVGSAAPPDPQDCARLTRSPLGDLVSLDDGLMNAGSTSASGIDLGLRYLLPTAAGRFGLRLESTYLIGLQVPDSAGKQVAVEGNYDLGAGAAAGGLTPHLKFNAAIDYAAGPVSAGLRGRYIGGFDECANAAGNNFGPGSCADQNLDFRGNPYPVHHVPAQATFDLYASYLLKGPLGNTTVAGGIRNLFDASPPVVYDSLLTYADPAYDFAGRFIYGRVTHQF